MRAAKPEMNQAETNVLKAFRRFRIQPHQMLFFNPGQTKSQAAQFRRTIQSMIERGYIVQERHRDAYSLTSRGYEISLRCDITEPAVKLAPKLSRISTPKPVETKLAETKSLGTKAPIETKAIGLKEPKTAELTTAIAKSVDRKSTTLVAVARVAARSPSMKSHSVKSPAPKKSPAKAVRRAAVKVHTPAKRVAAKKAAVKVRAR